MKYKVGDKVLVRNDLIENRYYSMESSQEKQSFISQMSRYKGMVVTINYCGNNGYFIEEDDNQFWWTDSMLQSIKHQEVQVKTDDDNNVYLVIDGVPVLFNQEDLKPVEKSTEPQLTYRQMANKFIK